MEMQWPISSFFDWDSGLLGSPLLSRKHSKLLSLPATQAREMVPEVARGHVGGQVALMLCPGICWLHLVFRRPGNAVPILGTHAVADPELAVVDLNEKRWKFRRTESQGRGSACPIQSARLEPSWKTWPGCDLLHAFSDREYAGLPSDANVVLEVLGALYFR